MTRRTLAAACLLLAAALPVAAGQPLQLANNPALSPDGSLLAFDWNGDVWTVPTAGGVARPLTQDPARDRQPKFSPDGKEIAFISERDGTPQVYVVPAAGGTPRRLTHHSAGYALQGWFPDGQGLLVSGVRDHFWRHGERFFRVGRSQRGPERPLFDDYGSDGQLSPDGKKLLFTREGDRWWRKGYHGSLAAQVWLYDLERKSFTCVLKRDRGCRWPLWRPDGKGFWYVADEPNGANLREHDLETGKERPLTHFKEDAVVFPCASRDGSTIVFRHLFDLYRLRPGSGSPPEKIAVTLDADRLTDRKERRVLQTASQAAFTKDGLEIAFIAGGDLWVMDTELREPRPVTATPEEERHPVFSPDGAALLFVSDRKKQSDIWKATRADANKCWWQNRSFKLERLTDDGEAKSGLRFSPDGKRISYLRGRGDLWVADADGKNARKLVPSWNAVDYDWSPDGKWIVYAQSDADFNRDVWLIAADSPGKPYNLSRHPYNEHSPVWSPDGRVIAFAGRRAAGAEAANVCFVYLRADDEEKNARDRSLEKALDKINRVRKPGSAKPGGPPKDGDKPAMAIDFDGLHERVHRVALPDGNATALFWSPDSKKLAFTGTFEGKSGTFTLDLPDDPKPKQLTAATGRDPRWLRQGNQIVWLSGGVPASFPISPTAAAAAASRPAPSGPPRRGFRGPEPDAAAPAIAGTAYRFQALQEVDLEKRNAAAFDQCWRTMRDHWYDERLGNRDWNAVRRKYSEVAAKAPDSEAFATVVQLMLGELNGSHLGFTPLGGGAAPGRGRFPRPEPPSSSWREETAHLGVRFVADHPGPGLKVRDVLPRGPADQKKSRLQPGDVVLGIDGTEVGPATDLTRVLNGPLARDITLKVRGPDGKEREVTLRPISYFTARNLLYDKWVRDNRKAVEDASGGKLGYLHIAAMSMPSFARFEEELYSVGAGKEGLVIDVRENGGGSTTDHLLTALTQPVHAITVPRGGGPGYPQDRKVYGTWNKPIVVLCNQNSFSNAEIFSHAIKTLRRGQLVGVRTAGGVVSTGAVTIMDVGVLRLPFRGWFVVGDGKDMELNGAVPHHVVWPEPGQMPAGKDVQLAKAVAVLQKDVAAWQARPQPLLQKATER